MIFLETVRWEEATFLLHPECKIGKMILLHLDYYKYLVYSLTLGKVSRSGSKS